MYRSWGLNEGSEMSVGTRYFRPGRPGEGSKQASAYALISLPGSRAATEIVGATATRV